MATATKLYDTQLVILAHAARSRDGLVLPLPNTIGKGAGAATRALKQLLGKGLLQVLAAKRGDQDWERDENGRRLTLAI